MLFGGESEAQKLFNAFKSRVEADGGEISDEAFILSFYQMVVNAGAVVFMQNHGIVLFPEARRLTASTTNVNKMYSLFDPIYDATETVAASQPPLLSADRNGRDAINYINGRRLLLSGAALNFTRATDYIELSGVHNSVVTTTSPHLLYFSISTSEDSVRASIGMASGDDRMFARRLDNDPARLAQAARISDYRLVSGRNRYDLGEVRLFRNNAEVAVNPNLTKGMTPDTPSQAAAIGTRFDDIAATRLEGKGLGIYAFNSQVPAALRTGIDNFFLNAYDLPA